MRKVITVLNILFICFFSQSCTTSTKATVYSATGGAVICGSMGYAIGKDTSPNKQSEKINQLIGAAVGAVGCGLLGGWLGNKFYKDDPENFTGEPIKIKNSYSEGSRPVKLNRKINLNDLGTQLGK
jgi:uncharacterized membrane protein